MVRGLHMSMARDLGKRCYFVSGFSNHGRQTLSNIRWFRGVHLLNL
jgi:hypothetical protein